MSFRSAPALRRAIAGVVPLGLVLGIAATVPAASSGAFAAEEVSGSASPSASATATGSASASPSTSTSATPAPEAFAISLDVEVQTITAGNAPLLGGFVVDENEDPVAGQSVQILQKAYGTTAYSLLTTVSTDADGFYVTQIRPQVQTGYVARVDEGLQTDPLVVYVYNRVNLSAPAPNAVLGNPVTIRGDLDPDFGSVRVGVATLINGRFVYRTQGVTGADGSFVIPATLPRGTYTLVVYTSARQGTLKGAKSVRITVG